jgi:DNA-directed RNA polymerase specialized sigma24 family protein
MDHALEASFDAFVHAAQRGDRPAMNHALKEITGVLSGVIRKAAPASFDASARDDLEQDVLARLLKSPPTRPDPGAPAAATVVAWVRRTTLNLMQDGARAAKRWRLEPIEHDDDAGRALPTAGSSGLVTVQDPESLVAAARDRQALLATIRRILDEHYPLGRPLFDATIAHPELIAIEYAELLGISRPNFDTRSKRIREVLADHLSELEPFRRPLR